MNEIKEFILAAENVIGGYILKKREQDGITDNVVTDYENDFLDDCHLISNCIMQIIEQPDKKINNRRLAQIIRNTLTAMVNNDELNVKDMVDDANELIYDKIIDMIRVLRIIQYPELDNN